MGTILGYNVDVYVRSLARPTKVEATPFQRSGRDLRLSVRVSSEVHMLYHGVR
jgi:hypothetical protein